MLTFNNVDFEIMSSLNIGTTEVCSTRVRSNDLIRLRGVISKVLFASETSNYVIAQFVVMESLINAKQYLTTGKVQSVVSAPRSIARVDTMKRAVKEPQKAIVKAKHVIVEPKVVLIKGVVAAKQNYFFHDLSVVSKWDDVRGQSYYYVIESVSTRRIWDILVFSVCETILMKENNMSFNEFQRIMEQYFQTRFSELASSKKNKVSLDPFKLPQGDPFVEKWYARSEFCAWDFEKKLRDLIPGGIAVMKREEGTLPLSSFAISKQKEDIVAMAKDPSQSWILTSRSASKKHFTDVKFSPVSPKNKLLNLSPLHARALKTYFGYYGRYRSRAGSTSFIPLQSDGEDVFQVLCKEMNLLVEEHVETQLVYTFKKDYDNQVAIVNFYRDLFERALRSDGPSENPDYVPNESLTTEQASAVAAVKMRPFLNVVGLPGRGKSYVIFEICKRYLDVAVVTHVASLAADLRKKTPNAITIHSVITKNKFCKALVKETYANVKILVIDEFEDIPDDLARKLFSNVFPNLVRIVHVFDPKQIGPISPGGLAIDFLKVTMNSPYTHVLKKQFRFEGDETGTSNVLFNDEQILKGSYGEMKYDVVYLEEANENSVEGDAKDLIFLYSKAGEKDSEKQEDVEIHDVAQLKNALNSLKTRKCIFNDALDSTNFQCIAATNKYKDVVNTFVESIKNPKGYAFYKNQSITVVDGKFKSKSLGRVKKTNNNNNNKNKSSLPNRRKSKKSTEKTEEDLTKKDIFGSEFNNGESYSVSHCIDFNVNEMCWIESSRRDYVTLQEIQYYDRANLRRCLITTTGAILCVHPDFVPFSNIKPGWAVTVDKAKGVGYENVLLVFDSKKDKSFFDLNHVHVALTRARKRTYVLNTPEALFNLCKAPKRKKILLFRMRLKKWYDEEVVGRNESPTIPERKKDDKNTMVKRKRKFILEIEGGVTKGVASDANNKTRVKRIHIANKP